MDTTTANTIFAAAATATDWEGTNLGLAVKIQHQGSTYFVQLPIGGPAFLAQGPDSQSVRRIGVSASWSRTIDIIDNAGANLHLNI
jgi:hypothetical protein